MLNLLTSPAYVLDQLMTPAEFDTRRRSLGLSIGEVAALVGVSEKTINNWTRGQTAIPADVVAALGALEDAMAEAVENVVEIATDMTDEGPLVLWRYRTPDDQARSHHASSLPLGAHAMMIGWAADALEAEGVTCVIEWADQA